MILDSPDHHDVVLYEARKRCWLLFRHPSRLLIATRLEEVRPLLAELERRVQTEGLFAAGFLAYEAAPAFDSALHVQPPPADFPLVWFGLYPPPEAVTLPSQPAAALPPLSWQPSLSQPAYDQAIHCIKEHIAAGHTYQVNFTFRLRALFARDPWAYFLQLVAAQQASYGAFVDTGRFAICSASPELFFRLDGSTLSSRPMKGTAPRALTAADDEEQAQRLRHSTKDQAENVMIVDMIRNDMGRIARTGSVRVPALFTVEKYPTVWQMTSTVEAETDAGPAQILEAMFPCASITGAPRPRTMQIIAQLEQGPRRIYTGSIGYVAPTRQAQFNVAIRTVLVDRQREQAEYGVGGGIVWDSTAESEYAECAHKARLLTTRRPPFQLLETLLWTQDGGYFLLEQHLQRLQASAAYFDFQFTAGAVRRRLEAAATGWEQERRVRLLLAPGGQLELTSSPLQPLPLDRLCLAATPLERNNPFLYHKTTNREPYEQALAAHPDCDDVLLWNEAGELTEFCRANLVVQIAGRRLTPPVECGLLPGTYRQWLIDQGLVEEAILHVDDLPSCEQIWWVNSVRKSRPVTLAPPTA